jgi:hypothetical protein
MSDTAPLLADDTPMKMAPSAQSLPAYSQLFDYNGDRKIDYSVQLPPYTPYLPVVAVTTSPPLDVGSACKSKALDCNVISDEGMLDADDRS